MNGSRRGGGGWGRKDIHLNFFEEKKKKEKDNPYKSLYLSTF